MSTPKHVKKAARAIQDESLWSYMRARQWVLDNAEAIQKERDKGLKFPDAALSAWIEANVGDWRTGGTQ